MAQEINKTQISASVKDTTVEQVNKIAEKEIRSFSTMVDILLEEAVAARNKKSKRQLNSIK